jgi:cytochrome c553
MKIVSLKCLSHAAILATAFAAASRAEESSTDTPTKQEIEAKFDYCRTCHGVSGQGFRGYYPMPRLAGQQPEYLENQLRAFIERRRINPVMFNVAHVLSPSMVATLAAHFRDLNPSPYGGAPKESLALGKTIFEQGLPESNVPACSACHGPDAKGKAEIPSVAGQLYWYTVKTLTNWSKERGQGSVKDTSAIMVPTTHNLSQSQIAAIAAYVSNLR